MAIIKNKLPGGLVPGFLKANCLLKQTKFDARIGFSFIYYYPLPLHPQIGDNGWIMEKIRLILN